MQKNSENFSMQEAQRLAESPAGQQLLALLQSTEGARLRAASSQAAAGDYEALKATLAPMLRSPEVRALLKQMGG